METKTVCIIGLGLIGGSLAAALKAHRPGWRIRASDRRRGSLEYALRTGIADEGAEQQEEAIRGADLVILATPVGAIRKILEGLAPHLAAGQIVTDVGSTKASIVAHAQRVLPEGVGFVGAHPIAGNERSGVESALEDLFQGRKCILTPTEATPRSALDAVTQLWLSLGAEVVFMEPAAHDRLLARLSHLPNLAAFSLLTTVSEGLSPSDTQLAGGALRDFTRVTQSPPAMWRDICLENRDAILEALRELEEQVHRLGLTVAQGDGHALEDFFRGAGEARELLWKK